MMEYGHVWEILVRRKVLKVFQLLLCWPPRRCVDGNKSIASSYQTGYCRNALMNNIALVEALNQFCNLRLTEPKAD